MGACLSSDKKRKSKDKSGASGPLVERLLPVDDNNQDEMKAATCLGVESPLVTPNTTPSKERSASVYMGQGDDAIYAENLLASSPTELNIRKDVFPNGDEYEGEHTFVQVQDKKGKKGKRAVKHGKGTYVYRNGSKFVGYYFEGNMLAGEFYHADDHNHCSTTYTGRFKDNHYHGLGRIVYHETEASLAETETTSHEATSTSSEHSSSFAGAAVAVKEVEYEGHFKYGMRSGHGKLRLSDGRRIEGFFKHNKLLATCADELDDDRLSWTAKVSLPMNEVYIGPMNDSYQFHTHHLQENMEAKTNESRLECRNGDVLKGYFENGKLVLPAKVERNCGNSTWIGEVDTDYRICGEGKFSYSNGDVYIGAVLPGGVKHGEGTQIASNGSTYKGSWINDEFHGVGTMKFVDGAIYTGDWVKGERHGRGTMTYHSGNVYEGGWLHDKKHGEGKATFLNGDVFHGAYEDDRRHGLGTTTHTDGRPPERILYESGEVLQTKSVSKPITNSVKFVGRMMGLRKHGDKLYGGSPSKAKAKDPSSSPSS